MQKPKKKTNKKIEKNDKHNLQNCTIGASFFLGIVKSLILQVKRCYLLIYGFMKSHQIRFLISIMFHIFTFSR